MSSIEPVERQQPDATSRPRLQLVTTPPARAEVSWVADDEQPLELKLGFRQLVLIHRSLQALRTLDLVEAQDLLVADTLQLIDVALEGAV
jgi:hypothetical protein